MQVMEMHVGLDLSSSSLLLLDIWLQLTDNLQTSKKVVIQILDTFVSKHMFNLKVLISFKTLQHLKALTGWEGISDTTVLFFLAAVGGDVGLQTAVGRHMFHC